MKGQQSAKQIPDREVLRVVQSTKWPGTNWTMVSQVEEAFPAFCLKVVRAKLGQLKRRKLIDGCCCGCRGDFELTALGRKFLEGSNEAS